MGKPDARDSTQETENIPPSVADEERSGTLSMGGKGLDSRQGMTDTIKDLASEVMTNALVARNRQLDAAVKATLAQRRRETAERHFPSLSSYVLPCLEAELQKLLVAKGYKGSGVALAAPPSDIQSEHDIDLACNTASIARSLQRDPEDFAREVAELFASNPLIAGVSTIGPFVNIRLNCRAFAPAVLNQIQEQGEQYGSYNEGNGAVILIDYSSPNVAKNMTVAHLRSTIIGHSLSKLYAAAGYTPLRVNHLGDWGTQFGMIVYQYRTELAEQGEHFLQSLKENPTAVLLDIYRKFIENSKNDPSTLDRARKIFLQLENGDPELVVLWQKFLEWSIADFNQVYQRLNVQFDSMQGESFYEDRMVEAVKEGLQSNVLRKNDEGAVVFPGQPLYDPTSGKTNDKVMKDRDGKYREEVLLKPTGGTVYLTRDLAAIRYRTRELEAAKVLYVIGKEQQRHCLMLFTMAEQLGYIQRGQAEHISFGHLTIHGKKGRTREGQKLPLLKDVLDASIQAADSVMREKDGESGSRPMELSEEQMQDIARQVGISALIFNDLRQDRQKDIEFSSDTARHVESGQSPYLQYTYCRLRAISEKAGQRGNLDRMPEQLSPLERGILVQLAVFPRAVQEAVSSNAPHRVATYMTALSQLINHFYATHPVTQADEHLRACRMALVEGCQRVLSNAAHLLHIDLPDRM